MRILLLTQFYPPVIGGEERHVQALAHALSARGHDVCVAMLWRAERPAFDGKVRLRYVKGTVQRISGLFSDPDRRHAPPFPDPELTAGLMAVFAAERPDIVHAHNWLVHSFLPVSLFSGAPLILTMHDYGLVCAKKNAMRGGQLCDGAGSVRKCIPCASHHYGSAMAVAVTLGVAAALPLQRRAVQTFIAVSRAVADFNGFAPDDPDCLVIPNFVPDDVGAIDPAAPRLDALPDGDFILFVGDLNQQKGLSTLVDSYAALEHAPPLVLIGRKCAETPARLPPGVQIIDRLPHALVKQAWSRCLFGVVPSIWRDPSPTVAMEGLAFGKPMIVSDIGGLSSIVEHGRTGLLVPPGDSDELARAMSMLLANRALTTRMGAAGAEAVRRFMAGPIVDRIEDVYWRALDTRKAGASLPVRTGMGPTLWRGGK